MKELYPLILIFVVLVLQACSAEQVHTMIKENKKQECHSLPTNSQYEECIKRNDESYDEYSRKRKEVINGKAEG
jgi:hypothetical protein